MVGVTTARGTVLRDVNIGGWGVENHCCVGSVKFACTSCSPAFTSLVSSLLGSLSMMSVLNVVYLPETPQVAFLCFPEFQADPIAPM